MNAQEELAWGIKENELRQKDLEVVNCQNDLDLAQESAKRRRLTVGLSSGQAVRLVRDAQNHLDRIKRQEEANAND